jgi:hypothetical protein
MLGYDDNHNDYHNKEQEQEPNVPSTSHSRHGIVRLIETFIEQIKANPAFLVVFSWTSR